MMSFDGFSPSCRADNGSVGQMGRQNLMGHMSHGSVEYVDPLTHKIHKILLFLQLQLCILFIPLYWLNTDHHPSID
jgi:hypothetical protein